MSDHALPDRADRRPATPPLAGPHQHRLRSTIPAVLLIVALGIAARLPLLPQAGHLPDMQQFFLWAYQADNHGLASVYEPYETGGQVRRLCNYPPLYVHVLRGVAKVYPLVAGRPFDQSMVLRMSRNEQVPGVRVGYVLFKLPSALADIVTALLLYVCLRRRMTEASAAGVGVLYVLQPMVIHNSSAWGQVDAIHTLFMVLSLEAASRRRLPAMTGWAVLSLLMKIQSLLLAPIWIVTTLRECRGPAAQAIRRIVLSVVIAVTLIGVVIWPFGVKPDSGLTDAYFKAVGFYPYVHLNAFNVWFLANPLPRVALSFDPYLRDDAPWLSGLTPKMLGMGAIAAIWLLAAVVLWRRRCDPPSLRWAARLLPLAFFVLPTQIHERYFFPIIAIWAWACEPSWRWWSGWIVLGACGFMNAVWVYPGPTGNLLADFLKTGLHRDSVGQMVGITCALAMSVALVTSILGLRSLSAHGVSGPEAPPGLESRAVRDRMDAQPRAGSRRTRVRRR